MGSHMPIEPTDGRPRWDCVSGGPFGNETICLIAQIWVVGDHPPGFVSRDVQRYFLPGIVPWIALEPRIPAGT